MDKLFKAVMQVVEAKIMIDFLRREDPLLLKNIRMFQAKENMLLTGIRSGYGKQVAQLCAVLKRGPTGLKDPEEMTGHTNCKEIPLFDHETYLSMHREPLT
jgi:hypothetical protein